MHCAHWEISWDAAQFPMLKFTFLLHFLNSRWAVSTAEGNFSLPRLWRISGSRVVHQQYPMLYLWNTSCKPRLLLSIVTFLSPWSGSLFTRIIFFRFQQLPRLSCKISSRQIHLQECTWLATKFVSNVLLPSVANNETMPNSVTSNLQSVSKKSLHKWRNKIVNKNKNK